MKKLAIILTIVLGALTNECVAQCDADIHVEACIPKIHEGFNYLKNFEINGQGKDKVEYSYVFTKGTQYFIDLCSEGDSPDGIIVSIYNSSRRQVATSYVDNTFNNAIIYVCNATGIYYITYTFKGSKKSCGGSVLAFKR